MAARANARNSKTRRDVREAIKAFNKALASGNSKKILEAQTTAISALDVAAKKAVIHKNKAARQKASLARKAKVAGAKPAKVTAKKAPAKSVASKKKTAKPAAKKAVKK